MVLKINTEIVIVIMLVYVKYNTIFYASVIFLLYGLTDEFLGPTLIELSCLASKPLKIMSWIFFSHDLGLLVGTLFGSLLILT